MKVNQKGCIGLTKVMADLSLNEYEVFLPVGDHGPIDLIAADQQMNLKRIQVKYRESIDKGKAIFVSLDSVVNGKRVASDISKIDCWAIYNPDTDLVCYYRKDELTSKGIRVCLWDFPNRKNKLITELINPKRIWKTIPDGDGARLLSVAHG